MGRLIDLTLPYDSRLPAWPGEPKPTVRRIASIKDGDAANVTHLSAAMHFGTHVDAPVHFIEGAAGVETLDLDVLIGPAWVAELDQHRAITAADLEAAGIPAGTRRLLLRTPNSALWTDPGHPFHQDFVALAPDAARWLVEAGVRLVGVDYLSVEPFDAPPGNPTHTILLAAGIIPLEGLDLRQASPGAGTLICLPLKLPGADGAPARVVLMQD
ncbi:hypothetical protein WV31_13080 [Magnetospirillum sp. ME-1]|uniref:cyclase family protein n=1 Tax=Magnetospirillum sp. ME-1 TaxID=1639348 RepID=UPI000A17CD13|nr:cyclase family protein [Magnetospirillum sp. ME-1]ARJ66535.1 hypothetical protein WV31_13080 [Magnetospirillum sp. ME-1]